MSTSELIAQQILNGNINKRTWGDLIINVKVYGAKGDGVQNDSVFIQTAFDAAKNGGVVVFPQGTYLIDTALTGVSLEQDDYLGIIGYDAILKPSTKMSSIKVRSKDTTMRGTVSIEGFTIDGTLAGTSYDSPTFGLGIDVSYVRKAIIEKNVVKNVYGQGISLTNFASPSVIRDNDVLNTWGLNPNTDTGGIQDNYGDGIYIANGEHASVTGNKIYNDTNVTNQYGRCGVVFEYNTKNCVFESNRVFGYTRGVHIEASLGYHRISNNSLTGSDLGILCTDGNNIFEGNYITNEGARTGLVGVITPRALVYLFAGNNKGNIFRKNFVKEFTGNAIPDYLFLTQSNEITLEDNYFESQSRKNLFMYGTSNHRVVRNTIICGWIDLGNGANSLFEKNKLDINIISQASTPKPGNTFRQNDIYRTGGYVGEILGYNSYGNFIENTITDFNSALIVNDGSTGGSISGNTLIRNTASGITTVFLYPPINRTPYYCSAANIIKDNVAVTTTTFIPYSETYTDEGRRITGGTAAPTTGTWVVGDMVKNMTPAASGYIGWICTVAGTPGTWKGFGLIQA